MKVLPAWRAPPVEFFALYQRKHLVPPKLRVFLDELEANLRL